MKQLRLDLQSLREEQMANAKVYGFQETFTEVFFVGRKSRILGQNPTMCRE